MDSYCEVGDHPMNYGEWVSSCAVCNVKFCLRHQGNNSLPGDLVACPKHVEQVDVMNEAHWRLFFINRRQRS